METPDTPAQAKAREEFNEACCELANASMKLKQAMTAYELAASRYMTAEGAARQAGIVK